MSKNKESKTNIIVVANQKGGVGKTTVVVNMAHYYHSQGKKVLVVDLDGQGNASSTIGIELSIGVESKNLFSTKKLEFNEPKKGIGLISADFSLNDVEELDLEAVTNPREHLKSIEWADIIIIDTPPSIGKRLLGAIIASDYILAPMDLSRFAEDGIGQLMETIDIVQKNFNPDLQFLGVLANKVNTRSSKQKETLAGLFESLGSNIISQVVANRASIGDSIDNGEPISSIKTGAGRKGAEEFRLAFECIEQKINEYKEA